MIELNLLPKELRKQKKKGKEPSEAAAPITFSFNIQMLPICAGAIGVLVLLHFMLSLFVRMNGDLVTALESEWKKLGPQKQVIVRIKKDVGELQQRLGAIKKIAEPGIEWARLMSGLNQAVIPDVWLTSFRITAAASGKTKSAGLPASLRLDGYALGKSEAATSTVAKFINSLKKSEDFFRYFEDIDLQDMRSSALGGEKVMRFMLLCKFRQHEEKTSEEKKR